MEIQTVTTKVEHYPNLGRYFFCTLRSGRHEVSFAFAKDHVRVMVHNASNRVWKGLGKQFPTVEQACANYKNATIRALIVEAARMNGEPVGYGKPLAVFDETTQSFDASK